MGASRAVGKAPPRRGIVVLGKLVRELGPAETARRAGVTVRTLQRWARGGVPAGSREALQAVVRRREAAQAAAQAGAAQRAAKAREAERARRAREALRSKKTEKAEAARRAAAAKARKARQEELRAEARRAAEAKAEKAQKAKQRAAAARRAAEAKARKARQEELRAEARRAAEKRAEAARRAAEAKARKDRQEEIREKARRAAESKAQKAKEAERQARLERIRKARDKALAEARRRAEESRRSAAESARLRKIEEAAERKREEAARKDAERLAQEEVAKKATSVEKEKARRIGRLREACRLFEGNNVAIAQIARVDEATIRRWMRDPPLRSDGFDRLEQAIDEIHTLLELMKAAGEVDELPNLKIGSGVRIGKKTEGVYWTRYVKRRLSRDVAKDIAQWVRSRPGKFYPFWQVVLLTSQFAVHSSLDFKDASPRKTDRDYKTVIVQIDHERWGDFAVERWEPSPEMSSKEAAARAITAIMDAKLESGLVQVYVHNATVWAYRRRSPEEGTSWQTGQRRKRRKTWKKKQRK